MTAWEYRIVHSSIRMSFQDLYTAKVKEETSSWTRIEELGREGWEMVSALPLQAPEGGTVAIAWVFKRAISKAAEMPAGEQEGEEAA